MAERDAAAMRIHVLSVLGNAKLAQHSDRLARESLVQLDHVELRDLEAETARELFGRRDRADAHDARWHARRGHAENARPRLESVLLDRSFRSDDQRTGAIVDAGRIARRYRPRIAERRS